MKLYKLTNEIDYYYVIAENPAKAEEKLMEYFEDNDISTSIDGVVYEIEIIASVNPTIRKIKKLVI